ncbi:MAG: calcium-binding protein [Bdellovibrionaceae bacterium]|nr:calcium-binding protein [Pseudobdellovibrionaceae bacterium]
MKKIILAAAVLSLMALPTASWSQDEEDTPAAKDIFATADADKDGFLSKEEAAAAKIPEAKFDKVDKDGDGKISKDEFAAAAKGKKKKKPAEDAEE